MTHSNISVAGKVLNRNFKFQKSKQKTETLTQNKQLTTSGTCKDLN